MEFIRTVATMSIFGKPVVLYGGIFTVCSFLFTAFIAISNKKGNHVIPFSWHPKMAAFSLMVAFIHGIFAMSLFW